MWVRLGFEYRMQFITRLTMSISVPALIFTSLMKTEIERSALLTTFWASCAAYALVTGVFFLLVKLGRLDVRTYLAPLIFGNTGNLGLPLALFAFGDVGLGYAVVVFAVMAVYSFTFGIWLVAGRGSLMRVIKEPILGATLLGAVFMYQGWQTPLWATNTLQLIGQMAIPLMLITLGVALARLTPARIGLSVLFSSLKVVVCAASAWAAGVYFGLDSIPSAVLIVQVSTPVAVTSYLLAEKYGADSDQVAGLVVVSTLMSVLTLPVILGFLV